LGINVIATDNKYTAHTKRQLRRALTCSTAILLAVGFAVNANATFLEHWASPSQSRVEQLLSERMSSGLYDIETGGQIDLALYYAVIGQPSQTQNISDLPKLSPYLNGPITEPLKADIYVALVHEAVRKSDFITLNDLRQNYSKGFQSNLRAYTRAHAETFVLAAVDSSQSTENAVLNLVENSKFQSLGHYMRDRPDNLRRLSQLALARGDVPLAVTRAQMASLNYQSYVSTVDADPATLRGLKIKIEIALAEALSASGQMDLALRHAQTALSLADVSGNKKMAIHAEVIRGEAALETDPHLSAKLFEALIRAGDYNKESILGRRIYSGLSQAS